MVMALLPDVLLRLPKHLKCQERSSLLCGEDRRQRVPNLLPPQLKAGAARGSVTALPPSSAQQIAKTASNRPTASCSPDCCGYLPLRQKYSFLLAKIIQTEVLQH